MEHVILYVKWKKISVDDSDVSYTTQSLTSHGYIFGPYTGKAEAIFNYPQEDQEAINLLNQARIAYKLIDLTRCGSANRLKAKISRIETPTLILKDTRIAGVENIKRVLKNVKA